MGSSAPWAANAALLSECRAAFDWWERWSSSRPGLATLFVWAVAEATVWPILPDFLLVPMALGNRRRFYLPLAAAALGMAVGGTCLYLFSYWQPHRALALLAHLPTIRAAKITGARSYLAAHGVAGFLYQPWSGIPFKVWAIVGGTGSLNPFLVIPTFIAARTFRMAIFASLARVFAGRFAGFVRDFFLFLVIIYLALFFFGWWELLRS
jgi:membrane protein YqaA with SNARE-associated domain